MGSNTDHNKNTKKISGWNVTPAKIKPETNSLERVNLNPDAFDRLIEQHGVNVKVHRTMFCPNTKSIDGGEHEIDCPLCNGSGWLDVKPINTIAFIQSQSQDPKHAVEGYHDGNTVYISFLRNIELQYFTLIELCDHTEIFYERVARSLTSIDRLKYKALRVNVIIDQNGAEYTEGPDFKINDNGDIVWRDNKGPQPEDIYSIHYECKIQFRAIRALHTNRFEQVVDDSGQVARVKMPEQWVCTKEFLVRRKGYNGEFLKENPIPGYLDETPEE